MVAETTGTVRGCVEVAGLRVALLFQDRALARELAGVACRLTDGPCDGLVSLHVLGHGPGETSAWPPANRTELLDGEDEYRGAVDLAVGRAWVRLTGRHPASALWNFLRRLCARLVLSRGGAVLHAACVADGDGAYLFAGPSGAGKSTVCRLAEARRVLSDDLTAVRRTDEGFAVWGMPAGVLCGALGTFSPEPSRPKAAFRLVQDREVFVERFSRARAVAALMAAPHPGWGKEAGSGQALLATMHEFAAQVPCFGLHFRPDASFWACIAAAGV